MAGLIIIYSTSRRESSRTRQKNSETGLKRLKQKKSLDECYPENPLLPADRVAKAQVRALAYDLACELQPVTNLRVLQYLTGTLHCSDEQKVDWIHHWVSKSFNAFEQRLADYAGDYCFGNSVTLADICLLPQVYNAQRFNVPLEDYPNLQRVHSNLLKLDAVQQALPENQPDAQ